MKHLRLTGEQTPASLGSPTPLAILPSLFSWMRGRRVVDRREVFSISLPPVTQTVGELREEVLAEMNRLIDERFGVCHCPNCGLKVAVLVNGVCRDCQPEDAA